MGASPARLRKLALTRLQFPQINFDMENTGTDFKSYRQRALPNSSGSLAIFAAIRRASSLLSNLTLIAGRAPPRNRHRRAFGPRRLSRRSRLPVHRQTRAVESGVPSLEEKSPYRLAAGASKGRRGLIPFKMQRAQHLPRFAIGAESGVLSRRSVTLIPDNTVLWA
jgi:hypothetical protein